MVLPQIIHHLTDTDMYKFSMGQAIHHLFPGHETTWTFKLRNKDVKFTPEMVQEIKEQIQAYCKLTFQDYELDFLGSIVWIKKDYILDKEGLHRASARVAPAVQKLYYQYGRTLRPEAGNKRLLVQHQHV